LVLSLPLVLGTCRLGDLTGTPDDPVREVVVSGTIVGVADTATVSATVLVDGTETAGAPLRWRTSNPAVATVDSTGMVRGMARGKAAITARLVGGSITTDSTEASDTVWVVAASLALAPDDTTLTAADDSLCLRPVARDANGAPLGDVSPAYSVTDDPDSTITLSAGGCVVSRTSGRAATVMALLDTASAAAAVTVRQTVTQLVVDPDSAELLAIGATAQLDADAQDRNGNSVPVSLIDWTSSDESVATVDTVGEVTATGAGSAWIHATADQLEDSAYIAVNPPDLNVTPNQVSKTAFQGSAATATEDLSITNTGTGSPTWTATKSASWLSLSKTSGGMPDNVTLTLDPAGLAEGVHRDTVVITAAGASGSPAKVPVEYTIEPCAVININPDVEPSGTLTTSDCGAPSRDGSFAKVYAFDGNAGETVTLSMEGTFAPYLIVTDGAGTVLDESVCPNDVGLTCLNYDLPALDTYRVEASTRDPGVAGNFTLRAVIQDPPEAPTLLRQRESDSTTAIPAGGTTTETTVVLRANVSDTDLGDTLTLEAEVRPSGQAFSNTATDASDPIPAGTGIDIPVAVTGLGDNTGYRWQVRAVDKTGRSSAWVGFGSDPAFVVDQAPEDPDDPTSLEQYESDSATVIPAAGTTEENTVVLKANVADPDPGEMLQLEAEVKETGSAFNGSGTVLGEAVASGAVAAVRVTGLADDTDYKWRVRTVDEIGRRSAWVEFGVTDPDFSVAVPQPPSAPTGTEQTKTDATPLAVGDTTDEASVIVNATMSDPDPGDQIRLQVEMRPVGTPFTDVPTNTSTAVASGDTATVVIAGLTDDTDYHWQFRAIDQDDSTSAWTSFGGNAESEADFHVAVPEPPDEPGGDLNQYKGDGTTVIAIGGTTAEDIVRFKATVTDPDPGDMLWLQVEVQLVGTAFTGTETATGLAVASGSVAQVPVAPLADGSYHWQARVIDGDGNTSAWVSFGGNPETAIDFIVDVP
jgi:hypothetical protein